MICEYCEISYLRGLILYVKKREEGREREREREREKEREENARAAYDKNKIIIIIN